MDISGPLKVLSIKWILTCTETLYSWSGLFFLEEHARTEFWNFIFIYYKYQQSTAFDSHVLETGEGRVGTFYALLINPSAASIYPYWKEGVGPDWLLWGSSKAMLMFCFSLAGESRDKTGEPQRFPQASDFFFRSKKDIWKVSPSPEFLVGFMILL